MSFVIAGNSASTGYNLTRSLRTRASASGYLSRTPASASNRQTWTWSGWVKRGTLGAAQQLFGADSTTGGGSIPRCQLVFTSADQLDFSNNATGSSWVDLISTPVYRDPSAWYHVVCAIDTTQATSSNRVKLYINGVQITAFGTSGYPAQNDNTPVNSTGPHNIARYQNNSTQYFDGYLTEVNFIDGQALTPSSFGSTNALTGVWQPARYTGTYGTNGFYLPFTDNSALTTSSNVGLGKDFSGNGNYWTTNNISITAGVTYDSMTDVPTLTSATASNFAVLNPLDCDDLSTGSVTDGNLSWKGVYAGKNGHPIRSTFRTPPTGKWYVEARNVTFSGSGNSLPIGFTYSTQIITSASVFASTIDSFIGVDATVFSNAVTFRTNGVSASLAAYTTLFSSCSSGDVINFAIDLNAGKFWIGKNGTWYNSGDPAAGTNATSTFTVGSGNWTFLAEYVSAGDNGNRSSAVLNFGQQPFTLTPPSGFLAMNTFNLPTSTIVKGNTVMDATIYTGAGGTQSITNAAGFKPDFVWAKSRSNAFDHCLYDSVRGAGVAKYLISNYTGAEGSYGNSYGSLSSFNSNGFTVAAGTDPSFPNAFFNQSGATYVAWCWQAGQGSTSSNTNGTITSTVSVNASAGFSIVTYTGNGTNGATVGHGLGVKPSLIIEKGRASAYNWVVQGCGVLWPTATQTLFLNSTSGLNAGSGVAAPTSSVFTPAALSYANESGLGYVAYCWTPIAGYSAFGSYTGNGSTDGPFVYTGFRPKFVMIKGTSVATNWNIFDSSRNTYNLANLDLYPNVSDAETVDQYGKVDLLSNGFKLRPDSTTFGINQSGASYIYMAFAESPFRNSLAR
jgi:hypothetical protein